MIVLVYFVDIIIRTNWSASISHASLSSKEIELSITMQTLCDVSGVKKVQVGKDQGKAQSEKDSHSKNRGGKKTN